MQHRNRLPLMITGGLVVVYCIVVLIFVATSPDLGLRFLIAEKPAPDGRRQGIPIRSTAGMVCLGELPQTGDVLLQVGEERMRSFLDYTRRLSRLRNAVVPPGGKLFPGADPSEKKKTDLPSLVERGNAQRWIRIAFRRPDGSLHDNSFLLVQSLPLSQVLLTFLWFVLQLSLCGFAALAFWNRPAHPPARVFYGLCLVSLGAFVGGFHWWVIAGSFWLNVPFVLCAVFVPAVLLHFFLVFPQPKIRAPGSGLLVPAAVYLIPLIVSGRFLWLLGRAHRLHTTQSAAGETELLQPLLALRSEIYTYLAVAAIYFVLTMLTLRHSYHNAGHSLERQQLALIWRAGQAASVFVALTLVLALFFRNEFAVGAARIPMFLASLSFIVAYSVAILRFKLMSLEPVLSKGSFYCLYSSGLTVGFCLAVGFSMLVPQLFNISLTLQQSLSTALVLILAVLMLLRLRDGIQQRIDRQFFREKYQLDKALERMNLAVRRPAAPETLADMALDSCRDVLQVNRAALFLKDPASSGFRLIAAEEGDNLPIEFHPDEEFLEALRQNGTLQRVNLDSRENMSSIQSRLRDLQADFVYAVDLEDDINALIVLAGKRNSLPFSAEDLTFLNALGRMMHVALHTARVDRDVARLQEELQHKIEKIAGQQRRIAVLQAELSTQRTPDDSSSVSREREKFRRDIIRGNSPAIRRILETVRKVAHSDSSILIRGESGTGKELIARVLHENSRRRSGPLVRVHCASLSPGLLESELFGHVKGAFTGAHRDKIGRFEMAHGGTLFLDEIGDVSLETQVKLLRVLQDRCFEPVGGTETTRVDVRLVAATHQTLEQLIAAGRFRRDLFYRLNVISLTMPPLRERPEDILELAVTFLNRFAAQLNKPVTHFSDEVLGVLENYPWPGNVRELENTIEHAVVLADGPALLVSDLPTEIRQSPSRRPIHRVNRSQSIPDFAPPDVPKIAEAPAPAVPAAVIPEATPVAKPAEREILETALRRADGNKAHAARLLNMPRSTYYSKLKKYGLS